MTMRRLFHGLIPALGAVVLATTASAQVTREQAASAFVKAMIEVCIPAVSHDGGVAGLIAALPEGVAAPVSPAPEEARVLVGLHNETGPLWDVESEGKGVVIVSEIGPGQCDVAAYGPVVEETFETAAQALVAADLGFVEDPAGRQEPPFPRREFRRATEDGAVTLRLDGAEQGAPGRLFAFSLLRAFVAVEAAPPETAEAEAEAPSPAAPDAATSAND